jgi:5-deoxy-glucuronate isomerase
LVKSKKEEIMKQYDAGSLIIHPEKNSHSDMIVEVQPKEAGWEFIHFQARRLAKGQSWSFESGNCELALIVLGGSLDVKSNRGDWVDLGKRPNVFSGLPYALYLPIQTTFTVYASSDCEFAAAWAPTEIIHEPRLVTPADVTVEIRGGDHATRQIHRILPPGFPCSRLVIVEVYTPGGNWSSYPPHKHDVQIKGLDGKVNEADLEEIYYYKIDRSEGFALQRIYTDAESPLHKAGFPIDAVVMPQNNDVVLIPEGYHPVSSPVGYTTYYLNILAGSAQSLAATDDPQFAWVKNSYKTRDARLPLFDVSQAKDLVIG